MQSKRTPASRVAFGGVLAALAVVIMAMGTLIPVATYVCPVLCCMILQLVRKSCGDRIGWAWYGAVVILSVLLAPDKEAAAVFAAIGYYPILKPKIDCLKGKWLVKLLLFNVVIVAVEALVMLVLAPEAVVGTMLAVLLLLGNVTFLLYDAVIPRFERLADKYGKRLFDRRKI